MGYAFDLLKQYKPKKINDLSIVNAALRPSGASYRDRLIAKQFNKNPSEQIDELLKENNGYLVFQEDTIKFLQDICGLSGNEADNIRRAIGRKQKDRLEKALPSILEGYCNKSDKPREVAEKEALEFLQIIEDSSNYQFGYNHSTGYSMITYLCAYLRFYYPLEFTTAYLNNASNEDDIKMGTEFAKQKQIQIKPIKFGKSRAKYSFDKSENSIYQGIESIKFCNSDIAEELYNLKDNQYNNFLDLLIDIQSTSVNSRQLDILIKLNFFSDFAKNKKLLNFTNLFQTLYNSKQIKKDKIDELGLSHEIIKQYSRETDKMYKDFDSYNFLLYMWNQIEDTSLIPPEEMLIQQEYLGYIQSTFPNINSSYKMCIELDTKFSPKLKLHSMSNGKQNQYKVSKDNFDKNPFKVGDVIGVISTQKRPKSHKVDGKWIKSETEYEDWITNYKIVWVKK